ncbi:MAG TPA: cytochrome c oxidase subunit 3 [Opitutus sp.]|nr:cytochrome c oxidase subunit 3 [Opitutus sp.]
MSATADPKLSPFRDAAQRSVANHLGLWAFLTTEILFFGGLFTAYTVYRLAYPAAWEEGSSHLEFWIGTTNTGILLTSSLCLALGDHAIKLGHRNALRWCLLLTALLGAAFLCLKGYEYSEVAREHLVPGLDFHPEHPLAHAPQVQLFIFLYFAMTGLHAMHMLAGLGAIAWVGWLVHRRRVTPERPDAVEMLGLYWHFVDCVWVFLYPLLYLVGHR